MPDTSRRTGFSLIELVVVIAILSILAGVVVPRVSDRVASARDTRRMQDVEAIQSAIEQYYLDKGVYPPAQENAGYNGWDVSHDGDFIPELVLAGYLSEPAHDPLDDGAHHYRYYVYAKGAGGCVGPGPFYVLGVKAFENTEFAAKHPGFFECVDRDWSQEFAYVTGGGASYK